MVSRLPAVSTKIRLTTVLSAGTLKHRLIHSALTARKVATFLKSASTVACFGNFLTGIGLASSSRPGNAMRIAKWIGIGLAGIAGTILVLVLIWDWDWLRGYASQAGSGASGRTFAIDGDVDVNLGWVSRVRVGNV